jgi:hypothetical protein
MINQGIKNIDDCFHSTTQNYTIKGINKME